MTTLAERLLTVMVYMVGDTGLDYHGFTDLKSMKRAGNNIIRSEEYRFSRLCPQKSLTL